MAYQIQESWIAQEKFNVSLDLVDRGSNALDARSAASAVADRVPEGRAVELPTRGEIFIQGVFGDPVTGPIGESSRRLIATFGPDLGVPELGDESKVKHVAFSIAGTHVKVEQTLNGTPIYSAEISLHLDKEGKPFLLTGRPFPEAEGASIIGQEPNPDTSIRQVLEALKDASPAAPPRVDSVALPTPDGFIACHEVKVRTMEPFADWTAFVSAEDGVLVLYNTMMAIRGEAQLFPVNPLRGSLTNERLDNLHSATALSGRFAEVTNDAGKGVTSTNGRFWFKPDATEFDEPSLYHYLDAVRERFRRIGGDDIDNDIFTRQNFSPMVGHVRLQSDDAVNNAYYSPSVGELYFGDIVLDANTRQTARSREIVIHEYGHAVTDAICRLGRTSSNTQSRGMSEGYSDYFAASFLDDPIMGDYFMDDPAGFRNCNNTLSFQLGYVGVEHAVGEVWAGYLWSLRQHPDVGVGVMDALAIQSLYYLGPWKTILEGVEALVEADQRLFPDGPGVGRHSAIIRQSFEDRKS